MSLKAVAVQVVCGAFALSCGAGGSTAASSEPSPSGSLQLSASPEPVAAGAFLTYTIKAGGSLPGASPRILVHLPEGVSDFRNSGAGWICHKASSEADTYQSADHQHADCMSAIVGGLPALKLEVEAPLEPGSIRACAEGGVKELKESACITTTIVQGPP